MKDLQNNSKDNPKNDDNISVKVYKDGEFLSYCRASKARKLIKNKKASEVWKDSEFCIDLVNGESKMENLENNDIYTYIHFKNGKTIIGEISSEYLEEVKEKLDDNSFILKGKQDAEEMYHQFGKLLLVDKCEPNYKKVDYKNEIIKKLEENGFKSGEEYIYINKNRKKGEPEYFKMLITKYCNILIWKGSLKGMLLDERCRVDICKDPEMVTMIINKFIEDRKKAIDTNYEEQSKWKNVLEKIK